MVLKNIIKERDKTVTLCNDSLSPAINLDELLDLIISGNWFNTIDNTWYCTISYHFMVSYDTIATIKNNKQKDKPILDEVRE